MNFVKKFEEIALADIPSVGGKNASLGEMIQHLSHAGVTVPTGFAITAAAYWRFIEANNLLPLIKEQLALLQKSHDVTHVQGVGKNIRHAIKHGTIPEEIAAEIQQAYRALSRHYKRRNVDVAVRSSATAEDLPTASFAGQHDTFLHISGIAELLEAYKKCLASLFYDRAIIYRINNNFDHLKVALSVGIQKMIRSDKSCSGVAFSLDTETGFKDIIIINAAYGLGETIVQGEVIPDEYRIFKPLLIQHQYVPIVKKQCGVKDKKLLYSKQGKLKQVRVSKKYRKVFCLSDTEIIKLARDVAAIERYYSDYKNTWTPMDVEWAKDGIEGKLYIIQARPETVHSHEHKTTVTQYVFDVSEQERKQKELVQGYSIGQAVVHGSVSRVSNINNAAHFRAGSILVTEMTDPDWVPLMKQAAAIVTDRGGRTCHAAIVSRELGIPAVVGTKNATALLRNEQKITVDSSQGSTGFIYDSFVPFTKKEITITEIPQPSVELLLNIADPDRAYTLSFLPHVAGVGLARTEFIISNLIEVHPMACLFPDRIKQRKIRKRVLELSTAYANAQEFFIDVLAQGIASIAAAFFPKPVFVRFSDFKSNEYRNLLGGTDFEPVEENPMLGLRGASRYYSDLYAPAFALECAAMKKVRDEIGLSNIRIIIPFVRTIKELSKIMHILQQEAVITAQTKTQVIMMCEVPSNVLLLKEFGALCDGFSIGSNDLSQFTLAVDRDSALLSSEFDERDEAVKTMLKLAVEHAKSSGKYISICGQAPSDYPEIATFLIKLGISAVSLNADAIIPFLLGNKK